MNYTYNAAGRPITAIDANGTQYTSSATYWANGSEYQRFMPTIYFRTDLNNRLQVSGFYSNNGQVGQSFIDKQYNYAAGQNNGNIMSITNNKDTSRSQTFTYDSLNRIKSGWSTANTGALSWGENYAIDPWGNLMIAPMGGKAHGGNFQCAGDNSNRATCLSYDPAGNVTANGGTAYSYDQENRLSSTAGTNYLYDANGKRVEKSSGSSGTLYWYGSPGIIAETDLIGTLKAEYVFFGGKRNARIDAPGNSVHYYLSDHLNSTSMVVSAAGVSEEESDYSPFGTEYQVSSTGGNRYKFTGKERDSESQLDYFGARYYSNLLGRFVTPDPLMASGHTSNPQSWNRYVYTFDNPLRYVDPDGMEVPQGCAKDKKCQITVKVNVIWDKTANHGKGLTDKQKDDFKKTQIDSAVKDYAKSNIKLEVTYTEGSFSVDSNNHISLTGGQSASLNVVASNQTIDGNNESFMTKSGTAVTLINVNDKHDNNAFPLFTNSTEHELAHQFLGDTAKPAGSAAGYMANEFNVDGRVQGQHMGISQQGFREGLEPRSYAAPTNPEANKPQQH